ncbi:hypothetical protein MBRA1_003828 [Malassezia brasiliensis]|uniref:DUF202 domain-containing protein n=1 Tax=Malassezia brasiliensis TaxID=1821822 RepID=A0AAF0DXF0_9BASI|nr:hypothetical protein MBRA1_003828 [Malassezia brasiliensis]
MAPAASPDIELRQIGLGFTRLLFPFLARKQPTQHPHKLLNSTERLDLRASQRTFDGAYTRSALGQLSFALAVMRLFQKEFFWIGFANCVMSLGLFITAVLRYRMTMQYSAKVSGMVSMRQKNYAQHASASTQDAAARSAAGASNTVQPPAVDEHSYLLLPRFQTAGRVVAFVTVFVLGVEIAIIWLWDMIDEFIYQFQFF